MVLILSVEIPQWRKCNGAEYIHGYIQQLFHESFIERALTKGKNVFAARVSSTNSINSWTRIEFNFVNIEQSRDACPEVCKTSR